MRRLVLSHMNYLARISIYQVLFAVLASSVLLAVISAFPIKASALEISAQTQQVLPPGSNTCAQVSASAFTPYIYNGALNSFEFTLSDSSYVALIGSVGNTSVPFQLMTRRTDASGAVRIHVDIATTPVRGTLPLRVTLLSARAGQPVCLTVVSMTVGSGAVSVQTIPAYTTPATSVTTPAPAQTVPSGTIGTAPDVGVDSNGDVSPSPSTSGPQAWTGGAAGSGTSVVSSITNTLQNVCSSDAGAYRLWLILLVLYALIVGVALWAEFPMSMPWARTPERIATIILVLLLLVLGFWYFSVSCRAALWMPLVAFLIAVLGLLAAFWNHPRVTQLLLIQDTK